MAKKSRVWSWTKRKAKSAAKKAWAAQRKKARARRAERKKQRRERRAVKQTVATTKRVNRTDAEGRHRGTFWTRHPLLADLRDWAEVNAHSMLDRRDFRSGIITEEEFDALERYDSQEEWARDMRARRKEAMRREAARRRDADIGSRLTMVYAQKGSGTAAVKHVGFRPPAPRPAVKKPEVRPFTPPQSRPVRRAKRKDHIPQIVTSWAPILQLNARRAMAADGDLTSAQGAIQAFVESYPERRSEVHDHLGKMAEFGKFFAGAMDTFRSTLRQGKGEDNPGMPPEVVDRLNPMLEVGETIEKACMEFVAAYEDYFRDAIKAAQDEYTPSKQALTS